MTNIYLFQSILPRLMQMFSYTSIVQWSLEGKQTFVH